MFIDLNLYQQYYWKNEGGFSFFKDHSQVNFYVARVSMGDSEPDLHGTVMMLWGISLISGVLGWDSELQLRPPIT